jgi:hypothetical protein
MAKKEKKGIDPKVIQLEARLAAMEYFIAEAFKLIYRLARASPDAIEAAHEELRQYLRTMDMPPSDPAISDLVASELEEAHTRLLTMIADAAKGLKI